MYKMLPKKKRKKTSKYKVSSETMARLFFLSIIVSALVKNKLT